MDVGTLWVVGWRFKVGQQGSRYISLRHATRASARRAIMHHDDADGMQRCHRTYCCSFTSTSHSVLVALEHLVVMAIAGRSSQCNLFVFFTFAIASLVSLPSRRHSCDVHGFLLGSSAFPHPRRKFLRCTSTRLRRSASSAIHHTAVKTRNITVAIQFYSLLGFEVEARFRTGPARAAWLTQASNSRLELIEVPSYLLDEPEGMKRRALNLVERQELLGWNHLALDVTEPLRKRVLATDRVHARLEFDQL